MNVSTLPGAAEPRHPVFTRITRAMPSRAMVGLRRDSRPTEPLTASIVRRAIARPLVAAPSPPALDPEDLPTRRIAPRIVEALETPRRRPGPMLATAAGVLGGLVAGAAVLWMLAAAPASSEVDPWPQAPPRVRAPEVEELHPPVRSVAQDPVAEVRGRSGGAGKVPAPAARWFDVRSDPPHAAVLHDGQLLGYTPLTIMRADLRPGQKLWVERPGFQGVETEVPRRDWIRRRGHLEHKVQVTLPQITLARRG